MTTTNIAELFGAWLQLRGQRGTAAQCAALEERVAGTPSLSLHGVVLKLRMASIVDQSAHALWHAALSDLERLAGPVLPDAANDDRG